MNGQNTLYKSYILSLCASMLLIMSFHTEPSHATSVTNKAAAVNSHQDKLIILVHGLMRTTTSMVFLKLYLKNQGYQVYSYSYPSARGSIPEHSTSFKNYMNQLIIENPHKRIYVITHSMGGIIARESIAQLAPTQLHHIDGLIMLAPPNQGSVLAKFTTKIIPAISYFVKPLAELSSASNSYVHHVAIPKIRIGIIAGRYDAKVPPQFARLAGQEAPKIVNSTHTFIMNNSQTKQLILRFLEHGSFEKKV